MQKVIVHDVKELKRFGNGISAAKKDMERIYVNLLKQCSLQKTNWNDPQYVLLEKRILEFAGTGRRQLTQLEDSVRYIEQLVKKLENL